MNEEGLFALMALMMFSVIFIGSIDQRSFWGLIISMIWVIISMALLIDDLIFNSAWLIWVIK